MDLRKVEQELERISSDWNTIRKQRPRFDGGHDVTSDSVILLDLPSRMPSWRELSSGVIRDDVLFPTEEEGDDGGCREDDIDAKPTTVHPADATEDDEPTTNFVDSDFGMCLVVGTGGDEDSVVDDDDAAAAAVNDTRDDANDGGMSIWEKYAAKNARSKDAEPSVAANTAYRRENDDDRSDPSEEEGPMHVEDVPPVTFLAGLESLHERFNALRPRIEKFNAKLRERDPVTKKPRYGERTIPRVKAVIRKYSALEAGVDVLFTDTEAGPSVVSALRFGIQQHTAQSNAAMQARRSQEQLEAERLAKEMILAEERANQERMLVEKRKRDEERELARRAEEARMRRLEEEQAAVDAERREDQELLAMVPTLGADGVREQIDRMRKALKDDRAILEVALGSLYTLFEQIVRRPEEVNFRRVRRNHPKFMEDIGRHVGGREVLIAAGFKLEKLDGVPCFFSAEPNIETDMDGWSEWFNTLKKTLAVIEEEMFK
ncbi:hypothetical protein ACHAXA_005565 [Cyclostephanos tholiformis]|uniref:PUB domain-containing protein n=1 Tax=Cyclostephanos tholiformis TaxID=382380 RepID=A0ABD3SGB5_9STRA